MTVSDTHWDPRRYEQFADHRLRPALDLLARIPPAEPRTIVDLGCGTGNVARLLAARWPAARITGVDHSPEMLRAARIGPSGVTWLEADIANWSPPAPVDLVFSNAALHWLSDHETLFPRLLGILGDGGCLAVQMPLSYDLPSHRLMRETLAVGGPGGRALGSAELRARLARRPVLPAAAYHDLLRDRAESLDVWETEYLQELAGDDPVLDWVTATGLRPVLADLAGDESAAFLAEYGRRLRLAYRAGPDGRTLYPFRRLFLVAVSGRKRS